MFAALAAVTAIAVLALLVGEKLDRRGVVWIAKPAASTAFVAASLLKGAPATAYGRWVVVALVLSWWGDVLLIPRSQKVFLAGILSFLSAHVAYGIAFVARGIDVRWLVAAAVPLAVLGVWIGRYFVRHAPAGLKGAVVAYIGVLSAMVALALGAYGHKGGWLLPVAALAFYLSDISVALNRFVRPSLMHRAWGAPLYFGAQLLFAATASWS
ncbi:MAG: lysoplasmalogenase [Polyangiales bacterium]